MNGSEALLPQMVIEENHFLIDPGGAECASDINRTGCKVRAEDVVPVAAAF